MSRSEIDLDMMRRAVDLAQGCSPAKDSIPKVGAIIAVEGTVIGRGKRGTGKEGDDEHAEHNAFASVADRQELPRATLYTTLEPCTREVRSRPLECCTEQILQARIARVFVGTLDPNQGVRGKGIWELQSRGIAVELFPPEMSSQLLAMNERFIRFQQTLGARITAPTPGQTIELRRKKDGSWFGMCKLVCKCANNPDASIRIIVQHGGAWWPGANDLHQIGDTREWEAEVYFGAAGDQSIHIVKATETGAVLLSYYQDVTNRNVNRRNELQRRLRERSLPDDLLKDVPGSYQGIKMGSLAKGLESQAHVQVHVIKRE
jgi:pyrimidine deaminase RibD-like protein